MNIRIYQINTEKDGGKTVFRNLADTRKVTGQEEIDASVYEKVFDGDIGTENPEEIYQAFNLSPPEEYAGRSLSVSDVVGIDCGGENGTEYYFCDDFGFQKIPFDASLAEDKDDLKITVVYVEPGKEARIARIGTGLSDMQAAVNGYIEAYYPWEEACAIVCNDEGKFNGSLPNRAVYGEDGELLDVIFDSFFVCSCSGENFGSLDRDQQERYLDLFRKPERIIRTANGIKAIRYDPAPSSPER